MKEKMMAKFLKAFQGLPLQIHSFMTYLRVLPVGLRDYDRTIEEQPAEAVLPLTWLIAPRGVALW